MKRAACCFGVAVYCVGLACAQQVASSNEAESLALAEIRAQCAEAFIAVQPWVQLAGDGALGVGWLTSQAADGVAEWTQSDVGDTNATWRQAWYSEDGLRQANGTAQRAVIEGADPSKPLRFRVRSRPITAFKPYQVTYGESVASGERRLPALVRAGGTVSFAVFNDIHNHPQYYPLLVPKAAGELSFAVFNGDVLQDPQSEAALVDNLLAPMAWFTAHAVPCFFLRGNHETRGAFARPMKAFLALPENRYYAAMTFGASRVLFLDSGEDKPDGSNEYSGLVDFDPYIEAELAWLRRELSSDACRQATWRIVVVHIPPDWRKEASRLWHGERRMRERFAPLFDEGKVHVVISGHTHRAEMIEPCPDVRRGFRWPVFIGGAHPLTNATVIRVDADAKALKVACIRSDGSVVAEKVW